MLIFTNLSLRRAQRLLFANANFTLQTGHKIGISGPNGCGKSSLLALILGEIAPDIGNFSRPEGINIAYVAQETMAADVPALEYVIAGDAELIQIHQQIRIANQTNDGFAISKLHARLETIDGYSANSRAAKLMTGLGFKPDAITNPVTQFSGGWRMRLNLARALMCRSDLLLLDEPTNHLDLDAIIWLEEWLRHYQGTLLLISHDRDFLDAITNATLYIHNQQATL
ncbi:ABC transporter ATP-binding protein, partial [Achromatium sp. WMS2]